MLHPPYPSTCLPQPAASEQALLLPSGGHQEVKEGGVACASAVLEQKKLEQILENDGGYVVEGEG